jgi:hypothetical protein
MTLVQAFASQWRRHGQVGRLSIILPLWAAALAGCQNEKATGGTRSAPPQRPAVFQEVARQAGISFPPANPGKTPLNIRDTAGGGCAFLDFDGDDKLDILLVGATVALYRNRGEGAFEDVTADSGLTASGNLMGCAVGDFDNDASVDVFITGHGVAKLYRNTRGARPLFQDVTARAAVGPRDALDWATSAGFADLDGDGNLDLVVCRYVRFAPDSPQLCAMAAPDGKSVEAACPPFYYDRQTIVVYRNRGGGTFEDASARFPDRHGCGLGLGFADFDNDGRTDVYVANDGEPGDLYHNRGNWAFENVGLSSGTGFNQDGHEQAGMGVSWGDFDRDGCPDLVVGTFQGEPRSLYRNEGRGLFSYASFDAGIGDSTRSSLAFGTAFFDFDNDSHLDLVFANGHVQDNVAEINRSASYRQPMRLFRNRGDGTFADAADEGGPAFRLPIVGRGLAVGDYDNDGRVDMLVANLTGEPLLLHNDAPSSGHWIGVRVLDQHKRDALGAQVTVEVGNGRKLVSEVQTCASYLTAADPRVHLGLGSETRPNKLSIRWPNGKTVVREHPPVDRYITVQEPVP